MFDEIIPIPIPNPNDVTRMPQPGSPAPSVVVAKTGPSARTAPTALNADTIPSVIAEASESSRRNRTPSAMSFPTRDRSNRENDSGAGAGIRIRLTSRAEAAKVAASSQSARNAGLSESHGSRSEPPARNAKVRPPSGSVPYATTSPSEFAFASWRRGTRFGREASRAGVQSREKHSITNDTR